MSMAPEDDYRNSMDLEEDNYEVDYKVGYKKPPRATQFQKGRSGNPKGRPKASTSPDALLARELNKKITITENGRRKQIAKFQALMAQLVNKPSPGTPRPCATFSGITNDCKSDWTRSVLNQPKESKVNPLDFTDAQLAAIIEGGIEEFLKLQPNHKS